VGEEVDGEVISRGPAAARIAVLLLLAIAVAACVRPEDPGRAELRARLKLDARLSNDELDRVRHQVSRAIAGKRFRITEAATSRDVSAQQQTMLFAMLDQPAGMYDEGLRRVSGATLRVLNAPGRSSHAEIEASQRLLIDVETFLPRRYQFDHASPDAADFAVDLSVAP
jgi:hypothetical protein